MGERQLVCYPRSGACSLRNSVCRVLTAIFAFKSPSDSLKTTKIRFVATP